MASNIIDRVVSGTTIDRAIAMSEFTGSNPPSGSNSSFLNITTGTDSIMERKMAWGGNWKCIRMGILFGIAEFPSQSYQRTFGLMWGVSSGSRTPFDGVSDITCMGIATGTVFGGYYTYGDYPTAFQPNSISGSFFSNSSYQVVSYATGSVANTSGYSGLSLWYPNMGDPIPRRGILLLQISSSGQPGQ